MPQKAAKPETLNTANSTKNKGCGFSPCYEVVSRWFGLENLKLHGEFGWGG